MARSVPVWQLTLAGFALVAVCYGLARFAYGLFVPSFRAEFALSSTLLGVVAAGSYAGYCVAVLVSAAAVSRFGARPTAITAGVLATSGMTMVALSPNAAVLAAGVLIAGTSTGVVSPPFADAIARRVSLQQHDRAQSIVNSGPGAGIAVSGLVALAAFGGWRAVWLLFAVIAALVTVFVAVSVSPRSRLPLGDPPAGGLAAIRGDTRSLWLAAAAAVYGATSAAVWAFGAEHITRASGLTITGTTVLWVVLGLAELIGLTTGHLIGRWGLRLVWKASIALLATATAVLGIWPAVLPAVVAMIIAFGASYMVLTTVIFLWATRLYPEHTAAGVGFGFMVIAAGQALTFPVVGAVADRVGVTTGFIICAGIGALGALLLTPPHQIDRGPIEAPQSAH